MATPRLAVSRAHLTNAAGRVLSRDLVAGPSPGP